MASVLRMLPREPSCAIVSSSVRAKALTRSLDIFLGPGQSMDSIPPTKMSCGYDKPGNTSISRQNREDIA